MPLLRIFYDSGSIRGSTDRDRKRLNKLVRKANSVLGCPLDTTEEVGGRRMLAKLTSIRATDSGGSEQLLQRQTETPLEQEGTLPGLSYLLCKGRASFRDCAVFVSCGPRCLGLIIYSR